MPGGVAHVGRQAQLLALGVARRVDQRLLHGHAQARGQAAIDRGGEARLVDLPHAGRRKRAPRMAVSCAPRPADTASDTGAPQRVGLLAQGLGGSTLGARHGQLAVVLGRGLPDRQQVLRPRRGRQRRRHRTGQGEQSVFHDAAFSPPNSS
jgi:hypothetical protein